MFHLLWYAFVCKKCFDVLDEKKPNHFIIRLFSVVAVDDDGGKFEAFR